MTRDISKLIEAINRVGIQNVSLLSRMTGMPTETVRYTMKKRFPNMGLTVRTPLNHGALGLERYFVSMQLTEGATPSSQSIVRALSSHAFLTYWCRAPVDRRDLAFFSVPVSLVDDFKAFLDRLVKEGVLSDYASEAFDWSRHPELKSRYYDFSKGEWSINWDKIAKLSEVPPAPTRNEEPSPSPDVDATDTLIIKELELDSWRNIAEIARKLGLNDRTARWHYTKHVAAIAQSGYVKWIPVTSKELVKAVGLVHEFHDLSKESVSKLRLLFNNFPFAWFEGGRKDGYYQVQSGMPAGFFMESVRFLNSRLGEVVDDWKTWTVDLSTTQVYSIPYENFDNEKGWFFDEEAALEAVLAQKMKIK